ncbi:MULTISPECIES: dephospho-CoA kinase [unclassified Streptococcus]|uniref:dephospho-CoA kinase n=1 Tax=unclassified Streptococcus TaxID=2608887 RepID=UPI001071F12C|nr:MULTISPECIES: dephospho-CoA kinase [unclassified Streptococcus]MBF0806541.1 dephospho-CoA kinase [Streptococcus sp. 19428wA2_WM07]TFU27591.1 dephospho-CoA kinase [Streptococcus sp. WM07]
MKSKIIGLTGGIASGKSQVTHYLRQQGYKVVDADQVVHELQLPGGPLYQLLVGYLGDEILDKTGSLNRTLLAQRFFSDVDLRAWSTREQGRVIREALAAELEQAQRSGQVVFFDIPLLFEEEYDGWFESIWLVYVDETTQLKRLMRRNALSELEARKRLVSQWSLAQKRPLASFILDNRGHLEQLYQQIDQALSDLRKDV